MNPIAGLELADQLHDAVKYIHGTYQEAELSELGEGEAIILVTGHRRENFGDGFLHICKAIKEPVSYTHLLY